MALAVPGATVVRLLGGGGPRRVLGVQVSLAPTPSQWAERHGLTQEAVLLLVHVAPGSAAERAGLLPGDILLALNGQALDEPGDLAWGLAGTAAGAAVTLRVLRAGEPREFAVIPEAR
jgi:S1-C subfamily serine protease